MLLIKPVDEQSTFLDVGRYGVGIDRVDGIRGKKRLCKNGNLKVARNYYCMLPRNKLKSRNKLKQLTLTKTFLKFVVFLQ